MEPPPAPAPHSEVGWDWDRPVTDAVRQFVRSVDREHAAAARHRQSNFRKLFAFLHRVFGSSVQLFEYGSTRTRLALPDSDLDCVMVVSEVDGQSCNGFHHGRDTMLALLEEVQRRLREERWAASISFVRAAMPVVKFKGVGGVPVDLTCMGGSHHGLRSLHLVTGVLGEHPHLRPLSLVLKQLLRRHGLADSARGGLSSYATLLLTASFLTSLELTKPPDVVVSLGSALVGLLETLSPQSAVQPESVVFSATHGICPRSLYVDDVLVIDNPLEEFAATTASSSSSNLAHGCYRLSQVRAVAQQALATLAEGGSLHDVLGWTVTPTPNHNHHNRQHHNKPSKRRPRHHHHHHKRHHKPNQQR